MENRQKLEDVESRLKKLKSGSEKSEENRESESTILQAQESVKEIDQQSVEQLQTKLSRPANELGDRSKKLKLK